MRSPGTVPIPQARVWGPTADHAAVDDQRVDRAHRRGRRQSHQKSVRQHVDVGDERHAAAGRISFATTLNAARPVALAQVGTEGSEYFLRALAGAKRTHNEVSAETTNRIAAMRVEPHRNAPRFHRPLAALPHLVARPVARALASTEKPYNAATAEETNNGDVFQFNGGSSESAASAIGQLCAFSYSLLSDELVTLVQRSCLFSNSCTIHSS
jgi:hypothetical protein